MPQGSVLGFPIWNIQYDGLLRQPLPDGVLIIAYEDDVALIVIAKSIKDGQYLGDMVIEVVGDWLSDHGLRLTVEKTEAPEQKIAANCFSRMHSQKEFINYIK